MNYGVIGVTVTDKDGDEIRAFKPLHDEFSHIIYNYADIEIVDDNMLTFQIDFYAGADNIPDRFEDYAKNVLLDIFDEYLKKNK